MLKVSACKTRVQAESSQSSSKLLLLFHFLDDVIDHATNLLLYFLINDNMQLYVKGTHCLDFDLYAHERGPLY